MDWKINRLQTTKKSQVAKRDLSEPSFGVCKVNPKECLWFVLQDQVLDKGKSLRAYDGAPALYCLHVGSLGKACKLGRHKFPSTMQIRGVTTSLGNCYQS